jgi:phospholipid transport system substrate-binding protein
MTPGIRRARILSVLMLLSALVTAPDAWAGPPTEQLRVGVDRVLKILGDPELSGEAQTHRRRIAIGKVADEIFDFGDMARRSLGRHWDRRTAAEREEFVPLFTHLVQRLYLATVDLHGAATQVTFLGETVDDARAHAVVQTTVPVGSGGTMALDYRMHHRRARWQIYDVSIRGISLVANYREQFNKVIRTSSYTNLVRQLEALRAESAAPVPGARGRADGEGPAVASETCLKKLGASRGRRQNCPQDAGSETGNRGRDLS